MRDIPKSRYVLLQFSTILEHSQKTYLNLRASKNPGDQMKVNWIDKARDESGHVMFNFDLLMERLLAAGEVQRAYEIAVRREQVDKHGPIFKNKMLYCPFQSPKCFGSQCEKCLDRRAIFVKTHRLPTAGAG